MPTRRTVFLTGLTIFGAFTLVGGITCMSLEIPAAGVPLILAFLASSFCYLERNCSVWNSPLHHKSRLQILTHTVTPPAIPEHVTVEVQPLSFESKPPPNNPSPE